MTIHEQGQEIQAVYFEDRPAEIVLATNSEGIIEEMWPTSKRRFDTYNEYDVTFNTEADLGLFSITAFDWRTNNSAQRNPGVVSGGAYTPSIDTQAAYQSKLLFRQYNGDHLRIEAHTSGDLKSISEPTSIIIYSDRTGFSKAEVAFGSNGLAFRILEGSTVLYERNVTYPTSVWGESRFIVERILDTVTVYVHSVHNFVYRDQNAMYRSPVMGFVGFGTYSGPGSSRSTALSRVRVLGSTSVNQITHGQAHLRRILLAANVETEISRFILGYAGGTFKVSLTSTAWAQSTSVVSRRFAVKVDGVEVLRLSDRNGGSLSVNNVYIPSGAVITVTGHVNSGTDPVRTVAAGMVEITNV